MSAPAKTLPEAVATVMEAMRNHKGPAKPLQVNEWAAALQRALMDAGAWPVKLAGLALLVLLAGCARPAQCEARGLYWVSDLPLDCAAIERNVQVAAELFAFADDVASGLFRDVEVLVEAGDVLDATREGFVVGEWSPWSIHLAREGRSLVHELHHQLDFREGRLNTARHPCWEERGHFARSAAYALASEPIALVEAP